MARPAHILDRYNHDPRILEGDSPVEGLEAQLASRLGEAPSIPSLPLAPAMRSGSSSQNAVPSLATRTRRVGSMFSSRETCLVECPSCLTSYGIDSALIIPSLNSLAKAPQFQCTRCDSLFQVAPVAFAASEPSAAYDEPHRGIAELENVIGLGSVSDLDTGALLSSSSTSHLKLRRDTTNTTPSPLHSDTASGDTASGETANSEAARATDAAIAVSHGAPSDYLASDSLTNRYSWKNRDAYLTGNKQELLSNGDRAPHESLPLQELRGTEVANGRFGSPREGGLSTSRATSVRNSLLAPILITSRATNRTFKNALALIAQLVTTSRHPRRFKKDLTRDSVAHSQPNDSSPSNDGMKLTSNRDRAPQSWRESAPSHGPSEDARGTDHDESAVSGVKVPEVVAPPTASRSAPLLRTVWDSSKSSRSAAQPLRPLQPSPTPEPGRAFASRAPHQAFSKRVSERRVQSSRSSNGDAPPPNNGVMRVVGFSLIPAAALVALAGIATLVTFYSKDAARVIDQTIFSGAVQPPPPGLFVEDTLVREVSLDSGDKVFAISGSVRNNSSETLTEIAIEGILFGPNGDTMARHIGYAGTPLADSILTSLSKDLIESLQSRDQGAQVILEPGGKTAFLIVIPRSLVSQSHGVSKAGALAATASNPDATDARPHSPAKPRDEQRDVASSAVLEDANSGAQQNPAYFSARAYTVKMAKARR